MPNTITLAKNYADLLDEVYKATSVTSDLTGDPSMVRAGVNANEICYPQISVTGLGDYSRNSGYTDGTVDVKWKTTAFNYDRGTKLSVDTMDDQETFNIAFGQAGGELIRTKVAPEADAFCFATLAGKQVFQRQHLQHMLMQVLCFQLLSLQKTRWTRTKFQKRVGFYI